jgi:hypothetical protein
MITKHNPMFENSDDTNNDDTNNDDTNNDGTNNECDQNILLTFIKNDQEQQSIQEEEDDFEKL